MTHTLHRRGDPEGLHGDYILLAMTARGINREGSGQKTRRIWKVISRYRDGLANYGNLSLGNSHTTSLEELMKVDSIILHAVFRDLQTLRACLMDLKQADIGISIVVSGLYGEVQKICDEIGLRPHTVNFSLGVHGRTEKLPPEPVLEIMTMCGHAMVSTNLVEQTIKDIRAGKITYAEGATELSRMCVCGIFNPPRAEKILRRLA
jgi:phosphoglycolate phosphatase-like HAD superfamily hydrolase